MCCSVERHASRTQNSDGRQMRPAENKRDGRFCKCSGERGAGTQKHKLPIKAVQKNRSDTVWETCSVSQEHTYKATQGTH